MAAKINFDSTYSAQTPTLVLCTRGGKKIGALPAYDINFKDYLNSASELFCRIDKYDNGSMYPYWNSVKDFKLVWAREWNTLFNMSVELSDSSQRTKSITGVGLGESELSQIMLYDIEINTEADIARDDYVVTVLYDASNPKASLLNRIKEKAPHYNIVHVDDSIKNIQRSFSFNGVSIYDALQEIGTEINCLVSIDTGFDANGKIFRNISLYDLESYCLACHHRGEFMHTCPECGSTNILTGYGDDTTIFISSDNLAEEVNYSTDVDSVKNCFRLEAGDDLMTATIINCNPNGTGYIWYISDETKEDMSDELVSKLNSYDALYIEYQKNYQINLNSSLVSSYNRLVTKYHSSDHPLQSVSSPVVGYSALMNAYYDTIDFNLYLTSGMMPSPTLPETSAIEQAALLTSSALSPVAVTDISKASTATVSSSVLSMAKVIVDSRYQVRVNSENYSNATWTGNFAIENYSNDEDTAVSAQVSITITDDYEQFVKQKLDITLNKSDDSANDIVALFKLSESDFKNELTKYCLSSLKSFYDACQACLNVLIEQGIADDEAWADSTPNLYEEIYLPYYNKSGYLEDEIAVRESEIAVIAGKYNASGTLISDGMQTVIIAEVNKIQDALNFENYLGEDLWLEFSTYRREDTYTNSNYISDGLDNAQMFNNALEFIEVAKKEIYKSATLQHSISATLHNLLVMKEFAPIVEHFQIGNWLRIAVDDVVYRLRLIDYEIDFNDLTNLAVTFSDVKSTADGASDIESILNQAANMASSYSSVARQAGQGEKSNKRLDNWVNDGLALTNMKIVNNAENQNTVIDENGYLFREYIPELEEYDDRQLKIINRGLYLTNDNWRTSKAGIGNFMYYDPKTGEWVEAYGVIADTLMGNVVLSEEVGIYNSSNTITLDKDGFILTSDNTEEDIAKTAFTIQKKIIDENGEVTIVPLMYINSDGELVLNGSVKVSSSSTSSGNSELTLDEKIASVAQDVDVDVDVGGRNYIRNSKTMIFEGYGFVNPDDTTAIVGTAQVGKATVDGQVITASRLNEIEDNNSTASSTISSVKTVIGI